MTLVAHKKLARPHNGGVLSEKAEALPLKILRLKIPERPSYRRLWYWCKVGRYNRYTEQRVKMESIEGTNGLISTVAAYWRFIDKLNEA